MCEEPEGTFRMCPLCDEELGCQFWDLKISCGSGKVSNNEVFFHIFHVDFSLLKCSVI
mgnify:CR=1 FL=1